MLIALLLVARATAEWVEISQQHYHYTKKPARTTPTDTYLRDVIHTTRLPYQDKEPARNIYHVHSQTRKTYHEDDQEDTKNTYRYNGMLIKNTFPDDDEVTVQIPKRNSFEDVRPVRVNPFLQDNSGMDETRNTYVYQDSSQRNTYQNVLQKPTSDDFLTEDVRFNKPSRETYLNQSIKEQNWNLNLRRQNNVRGENTYRTNERKDRPDDRRKHKDSVPDVKHVKDETVSGKIERIPNPGSVKRVQLENTPVKSPTLNTRIAGTNTFRKNDEHRTSNDDSFSDDLDIVTDNFNYLEAGVSMKPADVFKHLISSLGEDKKVTITPASNFQMQTITAKPDSDNDEGKQRKGTIIRVKENNFPDVVETSDLRPINNKVKQQPQITTSEELSDVLNKNKNEDVKVKDAKKNNNENLTLGTGKFEQRDKEFSSEGERKKTSGEVKTNTMENILRFMKVVADTIAKNTRRGNNGKIMYLNELKNTLLDNIKHRIDATWPDDTIATTRRHSRSASPRGHVEFPSSESSLMTISFLTFAVFLIKLVLQVIQAYKHKTMMMAPLMVATAGRTVTQKLRGS